MADVSVLVCVCMADVCVPVCALVWVRIAYVCVLLCLLVCVRMVAVYVLVCVLVCVPLAAPEVCLLKCLWLHQRSVCSSAWGLRYRVSASVRLDCYTYNVDSKQIIAKPGLQL